MYNEDHRVVMKRVSGIVSYFMVEYPETQRC